MKRQVAILGATPEFVRWSIRQACPLRGDLDPGSVDATEKRLRAVRTAGVALAEKRVVGGLAISLDVQPGRPMAFRLADVLGPWGGEEAVIPLCRACPAHVAVVSAAEMAGCFGWLRRDAIDPALLDRVGSVAGEMAESSGVWQVTRPGWYGMWAAAPFHADRLVALDRVLHQAGAGSTIGTSWSALVQAVKQCLAHGLTLDADLIPPGFSDGLAWTTEPYCGQCRAPRGDQGRRCPACGKVGAGHPAHRRRVLGLRPYVPLETLVSQADTAHYLDQVSQEGAR